MQLRNTISDLIIASKDRVTFHPLLIAPRDQISPVLANNLEFVCVDAKPHRCLVVCKAMSYRILQLEMEPADHNETSDPISWHRAN